MKILCSSKEYITNIIPLLLSQGILVLNMIKDLPLKNS
jgi:hypothetical protein